MQLFDLKQKWLTRGVDLAELNEIFMNVLNCEFGALLVDRSLDEVTVKKIDKCVTRFLKGEPVNKIFNKAYFFGRDFYVDRKVLSPRADTENLVAEAVKVTSKDDKLLDLCTGTGAIGITLNLETGAKVTLADISRHALKLAKKNAVTLKADVEIVRTDMFNAISGKYNIICCNPPYIALDEYNALDKSVKKFDPKLALVGGRDGLDFYRILAEQAKSHLAQGGSIFLEIGHMQAPAVTEIFQKQGYTGINKIKDLAGRDRVIIIKE